jgi:FlaA1/EpsC-like NDP-sugar epimerase
MDIKDKLILISGGSGAIGEKLAMTLLENYSPRRIRIYSRDETKQFLLAKKLEAYKHKVRYFIGNIRDKERLNRAMQNVDIVIHLAALKHVGACEYNPFEAIKTNIIGLQNIIEVSIENNVEKFIFTSSDKAASPSNTMGVTKLMGEKLVTAANYYKGVTKNGITRRTIFYSVRFGNVLGSRGSLVPLIENQIKNSQPITLTHNEMTRYVMGIDTAINFIIKSLALAQGGEVFVKKMNIVKIIDLIDVLIDYFAKKHNKTIESVRINEIGMLTGEKLYEELFSIEEAERTYEINDMYIIIPQLPEVSLNIDINAYPNSKKFDFTKPFNSKGGPFLIKEEIKNFLTEKKII